MSFTINAFPNTSTSALKLNYSDFDVSESWMTDITESSGI